MLGASSFSDFADGSVEAEVASALYKDIRDDLLARNEWSFTKVIKGPLSQDTTSPDDRWEKSYALPGDNLTVVSVNDEVGDYDIIGDRLYTNYDGNVYIEYQVEPKEDVFPAHFVVALKNACAAAFAVPLTEDAKKADYYEKVAEDKYKKSSRADTRQKKNRRMGGRKGNRFPLTRVR
jgi:hypothetical protein